VRAACYSRMSTKALSASPTVIAPCRSSQRQDWTELGGKCCSVTGRSVTGCALPWRLVRVTSLRSALLLSTAVTRMLAGRPTLLRLSLWHRR